MYFSIYNLTIKSDILLLNAITGSKTDNPDVVVKRVDNIVVDLSQMQQVGAYCWCGPDALFLSIPNVAQCHIYNGQCIDIALTESADLGLVTAYIQGYFLAIILQQRKRMVLHGTTLQKGGQAIAICGASGMGKSTLAMALIGQGWQLIADDVCAFDEQGQVVSGCFEIKIWPDVINALSLDELPVFSSGLEKRQLTFANQACSADEAAPSYSLAAIYCLQTDAEQNAIDEYKGMQKFAPLKMNVYRTQFMAAMKTEIDFMKNCSAFISNIPVFKLSRDKCKLSKQGLEGLCSLVINSLQSKV